MDIKNITKKIVPLLKKILQRIKDFFSLPYIKTYLFLSFIFIIIFSFFTFPYEVLIKKEIMNLKNASIKNIYIGELYFSLINESTIDDIYINLKNKNEININHFKLNLGLYSSLVNENYKGDLSFYRLKYKSEKFSILSDLSSNFKLKLGGKNNNPINSYVNLIMTDTILTLNDFTIPSKMGEIPINISKIKFSSININTDLNRSKIKITTFKFSGKDLSGSIAGSIHIANFMKNYRLNLKVNIDADSKVLKEYKPLLSTYINDKNQISIKVKGTVSRPSYDIKSQTIPEIKSHDMDITGSSSRRHRSGLKINR